MEDWEQRRDETDAEYRNRQIIETEHWGNQPAPGVYNDTLSRQEQESVQSFRSGIGERLYEEADRYRHQQIRDAQVHGHSTEVKEPESLILDDRLWESVWSTERVRKAVVDIRAASGKNDWIDLGTDETLLNDSLAGLNPVERLRADELYREKNNIPIRAEILEEQSGKQLALSLSLLHWPTSDGFKAREFWNNWSSISGLSDEGITALGVMNSDEICVLKQAYEDSYGGRDLQTDLSSHNSAPYTRQLMLLLLEGTENHSAERWRDISSILTKEGKIDTFVSVMHEAPREARNSAAESAAVQRSIKDYKHVFEAKRILDELGR